jgi:hypothetical protein
MLDVTKPDSLAYSPSLLARLVHSCFIFCSAVLLSLLLVYASLADTTALPLRILSGIALLIVSLVPIKLFLFVLYPGDYARIEIRDNSLIIRWRGLNSAFSLESIARIELVRLSDDLKILVVFISNKEFIIELDCESDSNIIQLSDALRSVVLRRKPDSELLPESPNKS